MVNSLIFFLTNHYPPNPLLRHLIGPILVRQIRSLHFFPFCLLLPCVVCTMTRVVINFFGVDWLIVRRLGYEDYWELMSVCQNLELNDSFSKLQQHLQLVQGIDWETGALLGLDCRRLWITFEVLMRLVFKSFLKRKKSGQRQAKVVKALFQRLYEDMMEGPASFFDGDSTLVEEQKRKHRRLSSATLHVAPPSSIQASLQSKPLEATPEPVEMPTEENPPAEPRSHVPSQATHVPSPVHPTDKKRKENDTGEAWGTRIIIDLSTLRKFLSYYPCESCSCPIIVEDMWRCNLVAEARCRCTQGHEFNIHFDVKLNKRYMITTDFILRP